MATRKESTGYAPSSLRSPTKKVGVDPTPALALRSWSASMILAVACEVMHARHAAGATPAATASESKVGIGFWLSAQVVCVTNRDSCSGQNFPWTEAHMAASAAARAFAWVGDGGKIRQAGLTVPVCTYSRSIAAKAWSCHCLQYGHGKSLTSTSQTGAV